MVLSKVVASSCTSELLSELEYSNKHIKNLIKEEFELNHDKFLLADDSPNAFQYAANIAAYFVPHFQPVWKSYDMF